MTVLVWCVQHLLGAAANGKAFFVRAATHTGVVGLLVAFAAGYAVYGGLLLAATVALKWVLVGRMRAGRHRRAAIPLLFCQLCRQIPLIPEPCQQHMFCKMEVNILCSMPCGLVLLVKCGVCIWAKPMGMRPSSLA